jgi:hypothetical protein
VVCRLRATSAAKAGVDFAALTARLKAAPFQNKIKSGVFAQPVQACPFKTKPKQGFFSKLLVEFTVCAGDCEAL